MKSKHTLLIALSLFIILLFPVLSRSAEINIGGTVWYAWWDAPWARKDDFSLEPAYLHGPVVSIKFTDYLGISSFFVFGNFDESSSESWGTYYMDETTGYPIYKIGNAKVQRYDSETALDFYLYKYIRLFLNCKYMAYKLKADFTGTINVNHPTLGSIYGGTWSSNTEEESQVLGYGFGFGFKTPVLKGFQLMFNASGLYSPLGNYERTVMDSDGSRLTYNVGISNYGALADAAVIYHPPLLQTYFSLGFRYQYVQYKQKEEYDGPDADRFAVNYNDEFEELYCITFSVIYNIDL